MIDAAHPDISIARQCELIQLSRASYYRSVDYGPVVETAENLELMRLIDEEYTRHPFTMKIPSLTCLLINRNPLT